MPAPVLSTATMNRTAEQRRAALEQANITRTARAVFKQRVRHHEAGKRAGIAACVVLVSHPPVWAVTWKLADFLLFVPSVGKVKARTFLITLGASPSKSLGGLSDRQRRAVMEWLNDRLLGARA